MGQFDMTEIDVQDKYQYTDMWLKAPNGQPSLLNKKQWLQVRTSDFKNWFGDWENSPDNSSKILDKNGEPLIVFHGTPPNHYRFSKFSIYNEGIFFAEHKYVADRYALNYRGDEIGEVKAVFLNIRNVKNIHSVKYKFDGYRGADACLKKQVHRIKELHPELKNTPYRYKEMLREKYQKKSFDGLILENHSWLNWIDDSKQFVVFEPTQIKSATNNVGSFLLHPDIYC